MANVIEANSESVNRIKITPHVNNFGAEITGINLNSDISEDDFKIVHCILDGFFSMITLNNSNLKLKKKYMVNHKDGRRSETDIRK